jgi:hypothetical protein
MATQLRMFEEESQSLYTQAKERERIERKFAPLIREELQLGQMVSYVGNKNVPILRLYRYKEAFAFRFVQEFIKRFKLSSHDYLFDPFCGMGTTLFAAMQHHIPSIGIDKLPIAVFVAKTLPLFFSIEPQDLQRTFEELRSHARRAPLADVASDVAIMNVAFPDETLVTLRRWKSAIDALPPPMRDIFLLLFFAILEPCSYTAKDGQFLRLKRDKIVADPEEMLKKKIYEAQKDIQAVRNLWAGDKLKLLPAVQMGDARDLTGVPFERPPTAIITSPPYANRYDYTRTYSLELCFHFVKSFEELKALRFGILRSHIESKVGVLERPPHPVIEEVVSSLKSKALNNPKIPDMLTAYFVDMQKVIHEWARVLAPGAHVALVVDNVRFEGELVPVDLVLSEMAEGAGFVVKQILVARYKGNSSQQMGKFGRVPVRESVLLWQKEK